MTLNYGYRNHTISRTVEIELTPQELAQCFCQLHNEQQAQFFDEIYKDITSRDDGKAQFEMQLAHVIDCPEYTEGASYVMKELGNYALDAED